MHLLNIVFKLFMPKNQIIEITENITLIYKINIYRYIYKYPLHLNCDTCNHLSAVYHPSFFGSQVQHGGYTAKHLLRITND